MKRVLDLDPAVYPRHLIHGEGRSWAETNCYVDVLIELLHAMRFEPIAALPFTLRIDFEGDQWTFFKFPHEDLLLLFGLDIQEMNPWHSLVHHVEEQIAKERPVLVELDSFYLPDTAGTAYQLAHVKSTVAVNEIDLERGHMGYFHGQGYHCLHGDNFAQVFQTGGLVHERMLPPYLETVKILERPTRSNGRELTDASLERLKYHVGFLPSRNPFHGFKERFQHDLEWLMRESVETFHQYSFATLRQYGACFELVETYLRWLDERGQSGLDESITAFNEISNTAKTFQFQLARAMARRRTLPLEPLDTMASLWQRGMENVVARHG